VFFFLQNRDSKKFGSLYKILTSEKKVFDNDFSILLPLTFADGIFQKKNTHPHWVLVTTKQFQLDTIKSRFLRGRGTFGGFRSLGLQKLPEGGVWEFRVYDNFCSTHQDLSVL
jgi:hypothetical protein